MQTAVYEGPRNGDYARYVDDLLRASPLYRSAVLDWSDGGSGNYADAAATPGSQSQSLAHGWRRKLQAAAAQGQAQARTPLPARGAQDASLSQEAARAARKGQRKKTASPQTAAAKGKGFKIKPGMVLMMIIGVVLSIAVPTFGAFFLVVTIINAIRQGLSSAKAK